MFDFGFLGGWGFAFGWLLAIGCALSGYMVAVG